MNKLSQLNTILAVTLTFFALTMTTDAQTFQTLFSFNVSNGSYPGALVQGMDGNFYGSAEEGGPNPKVNAGTLFRITPGGQLSTIYAFCQSGTCTDGALPNDLVLGVDGHFYGTTASGGNAAYCGILYDCGTVFKVTPSGQLTTIYSFCHKRFCTDGFQPQAALIQGADGNFYGTTSDASSFGNVFEISPSGMEKTLYLFANADQGGDPFGALVQASDGSFYGTTSEGGNDSCQPESCGTVFRVTSSGTFQTVHFFQGTDGDFTNDGLLQASDGNFYGVTFYGGDLNCSAPFGCGTIFRMTPKGDLTTIHTFEMTDGSYPYAGLIQATDGNLYGTTESGGANGDGTIFTIDFSGNLTTLHNFDGTDGSTTMNALMQATSGIIYGTSRGGSNSSCYLGCGTIFSFDMGLGRFVTFVHRSGKVGQPIEVLGQGFTGTTGFCSTAFP